MLRWLLLLVVLVVVGAGIATSMSPKGIPVDVARAEMREIREYVEEQAKTRLPHIHRITMPLQGRLLPITLEEGDAVKAGQVVARLDPSDLDTELVEQNNTVELYATNLKQIALTIEQAEQTVKSSQAKYDFAERVFSRTRRLVSESSASEQALEQDELRMTESALELNKEKLNKSIYVLTRSLVELLRESDVAQRTKLERDRARTTIRVGADGVVLTRRVYNETVLAPGTVLLEIGDPATLEIEADILTEDVVKISIGDAVDIIGAAVGTDESISGTVARIYPQGFTKVSSLGVEQQRVTVIVDFDEGALEQLAAAGRTLGVDYRLRVKIYTDQKTDAVCVPRAAVFRSANGSWQAFVVAAQHAQLRDVKVGLRNDFYVEVLDGIDVDDIVIVAPDSNVTEGILVETN